MDVSIDGPVVSVAVALVFFWMVGTLALGFGGLVWIAPVLATLLLAAALRLQPRA